MTDLGPTAGTAKVTGEMLDRSAALFGQADEALRVHNRARKDVASHEAYGSLETARGLAAQGKAKKAGGAHSELLANCQQAETSMAQELTLVRVICDRNSSATAVQQQYSSASTVAPGCAATCYSGEQRPQRHGPLDHMC